MKRDDASGERRGEDDGLLDGGGQLPESVHEHVDGLDELAQGPLPAFAELDHHALEAAAEVFQVSAQVVVLGGGLLGGGGLGSAPGITIFPEEFGIKILTMPVGGFLTLGALIALMQWAMAKSNAKKEKEAK